MDGWMDIPDSWTDRKYGQDGWTHRLPASVAQLDARPTADKEIPGSTQAEDSNILLWLIFSMVILSLPLIQEGQLSVSGKRMCTILVNRLEDLACPVKVWLGKLTALDPTGLFVLRFYGPVNPMGSCRARSVFLTTRLLGRLSPLSG